MASTRVFPDVVQDGSTPAPELEAMPAEELLRLAYSEFGERLALTCSWQKQSSVLVHMVSELGLDIPVVELDTQLFFKETYETRDRLVARYGLKLIRPHVLSVAEPGDSHFLPGERAWHEVASNADNQMGSGSAGPASNRREARGSAPQ